MILASQGDRLIHASLIAAYFGAEGWRGALLLGASGAGKSDFALRALAEGWRLVADDRVIAWTSGGSVFGRAPQTLAGLVELRGQAVLSAQALPFAEIALVCCLDTPPDRQPEPAIKTVAGLPLPACHVAPFEASGPARLRRIVEQNTARL